MNLKSVHTVRQQPLTVLKWLSACLAVASGLLSCGAASVTLEAESGILGQDWAVSNSASPVFVTITSDTTAGNPGTAARVATYSVAFPGAGTYQLYARVRVGPDAFNDDSLFFASGFGTRSPALSSDWILVNGLGNAGYSNETDVVAGAGTLGAGMWKWVNLSQYTGHGGFTVAAGDMTQTMQMGARENGLDIDKLVFGTAGYTFTVAELDAGGPGRAPAATIDTSRVYQTIEGFGGAIAFYNGWITAHPYKQEIYTNAFAGLNLSMLRLGNWFRYQGTVSFDSASFEIVSNANRVLGRSVPILMSSWSPPAFLKSNGQVGHGGTLLYTNGGFAYAEFAQYWHDSLLAYRSNGISPTWISIQNEPDWEAGYDSCIFRPAEGFYNGTNYASYAKALEATFQRLTNLESPPKLLAPEPVGTGYNVIQNYAATLDANQFYGVAYHLYHGSSDGSAMGYVNSLRATTNLFPSKPKFMTEFGVSNMVESATLIHNCLTEGLVSGYNHWSLVWPGTDGGLIQIEFPWDRSRWTNAPPGTPTQSRGYWLSTAYWAMKHFSYYIPPGSRRVAAECSDPSIKVSAYLTPGNLRLVAVFINRSTNSASTVTLNADSFPFASFNVYQTAGTARFQPIGLAGPELVLPAGSLTTIVLDQFVAVGSASNPLPANNSGNVSLDTALSWSPGTNALRHALYLGASSNAVFEATPGSPEFQGFLTNTLFKPAALFGNTTHYWRVDEIAGANTNRGVIWSFTTQPAPPLAHRYSFSETSGVTVADSAGGQLWNGTLPTGGTFADGQLALASASQQHVRLPAGIVSTYSNLTIMSWVKLNSTANWSRIFDFGNNTTTYMFLTPQNGINSRVRFAITTSGAGGEQQITGISALSVGTWHHVAVTLDGNTGILYVDGAQVGSNTSMTLRPYSLGSTANNYLGRSQYGADPYLNATLDEFRIYSVTLSQPEIAATYALGPNQLLSTNPPSITMTPAANALALSWPLESAGFTVQSRTNLVLGAWISVSSPLPQIVGSRWELTLPLSPATPSRFYRLSK